MFSIDDEDFIDSISEPEKCAWNEFVDVVRNFLGNQESESSKELVSRFLSSYQQPGCNMSLKLDFLLSHLDQFPTNFGGHSNEQGERLTRLILVTRVKN